MKKQFLFAIGLLLVTCTYAATASQTLQNLLNGINTMTANFTQSVSAGGKVQKASGTMALKKPGLFRWTITKPSTVIMISDGKIIWMYDKSLAQVTVSKVDQNQGSAPAIVLSNRIRLLSNYFIVWQKNGWYYLNPRYKDDQVKQVQLKFKGQVLQKMHILDNLGQRLSLTFSNVSINKNINTSQFNFTIPKSVDVIQN